MSRPAERVLIPGPAGGIETVIDSPEREPRGAALVAHPHPLFGGTLDNKVVQTLARTFKELGYVSLRANFRGAGATEGEHDHGEGETEDLLRVAAWAGERYGSDKTVLAGFSFGAYVQTRVARRTAVERMVLIGLPFGAIEGTRRYAPEPVPDDTILIHGELDETVPLANVFEWARPQELPVVVIPGADHFFHRRLHLIRRIVKGAWKPAART
jgi:alpha/beta superfamily hydrolase